MEKVTKYYIIVCNEKPILTGGFFVCTYKDVKRHNWTNFGMYVVCEF